MDVCEGLTQVRVLGTDYPAAVAAYEAAEAEHRGLQLRLRPSGIRLSRDGQAGARQLLRLFRGSLREAVRR
jgi:hypothetical protein